MRERKRNQRPRGFILRLSADQGWAPRTLLALQCGHEVEPEAYDGKACPECGRGETC